MADEVCRVLVQIARLKLLRCPVRIAVKVPEGSGTKPSKIFQTAGDSVWVYLPKSSQDFGNKFWLEDFCFIMFFPSGVS